MSRFCTFLILFFTSLYGLSQDSYLNNSQLRSKLQELERGNNNFVDVEELTKTKGGKSIFMVTLGGASADNNPAIVVAGGVSGSHLLGSQLAVSFIENIVNSDSLLNSLNGITYYVFPDLSPDASQQYFERLKYERDANTTQTDDDRDGRIDEDPFEDLNNDGMVNSMRVRDATGDWIVDPADPRAMKKVDKSKGEKGEWILLTEGRDNDGDGKYNEDPPGGVEFNRNFTYSYPRFQKGAGEYQVSELENRAMLDYMYERTNIFAIITFGPADNLAAPMKYNAGNARKRIVSSILSDDEKLNKWMSDLYRETTGNKSSAPVLLDGGFMQWGYFHFGRLSLGTPGFYLPQAGSKDMSQMAKELQWIDSLGIDGFTSWSKIDHPDMPGKDVELGGVNPFVAFNPPQDVVTQLAESHTEFITIVASMRAQAQLENILVEPMGKDVYRVTVDFYNSGKLPAMTQMGERVKWVMKPKINVKLASGMSMLSGNPVQLLNQLKAGESAEHTWLIKGKGSLEITAGAPQMGTVTLNVDLK